METERNAFVALATVAVIFILTVSVHYEVCGSPQSCYTSILNTAFTSNIASTGSRPSPTPIVTVTVVNSSLDPPGFCSMDYKPNVCADSAPPDVSRTASSPYDVPLCVDEDQYTVVMLTHGVNRIEIMLQVLNHLSQMKRIHKIILLWNNQRIEPPEGIKNITFSMPLVVIRLPENKLRLRFQAWNEIETQGVYSADDDIIVQELGLDAAFDVWKKHAYALVAFKFNSRNHVPIKGNVSTYEYTLRNKNYSMVLTGAAFIHKEYLRLFNETLPQGIRDFIDFFFNCEDIAMNLLVANHTGGNAGLRIQEKTQIKTLDKKAGSGLSFSNSYGRQRSLCIGYFSAYFKEMPLKSTGCLF